MSKRSREEREPAFTPPERPSVMPSKVPVFDRPFSLSGMAHTTAGYCVVQAHYNDKGELQGHDFGTPQTWHHFVTTELLRVVRGLTNKLVDWRPA